MTSTVDGATGRRQLRGVARGGFANLVGAAVLASCTFLVTVVVTRGLEPASAGTLFAATSVFVLATAIGQLGTVTGLVYFMAQARVTGRPDTMLTTWRTARNPVLITTLLIAATLILFATDIGRLITPTNPGDATQCIRVFAFFVPIACLEMAALAATRGLGTMRPNVLVEQVLRPILQLALISAAVVIGSNQGVIALAWVAGYLPASVVASLWWRSLLRRESRPLMGASAHEPRTYPVGSFWRFSAPRALANVGQNAIQRFDIVLVAALAGPAQAAIYTAATRFLVMGQMGATAISNAVQPRLASSLAQHHTAETKHYYRVATTWLVLLTWPVYLVFILFGSTMLRVFGDTYSAGSAVLLILSLSMLFATACGMVDVVLLMAGKSVWNLSNVLLALTVQVVVDLLLIPEIGIIGAGVGWAAAIVVNNGIPLVQVSSVLRLHPFGRSWMLAILLPLTSFGLFGGVIRLRLGSSLGVMALGLCVSTTVYLVTLAVFRGPLELSALQGVLRSRRRRQPSTPP